MDTVTYVELNGVRAGVVPRPEEYLGGSLFLREAGRDGWLMPLEEILPDPQLRGEVLYKRFKEFGHRRVSRKAEAFVKWERR